MNPIKTIAIQTFAGGRSFKSYGVLLLILVGLMGLRVYDAQKRIAEATASGDHELVQMIKHSTAALPLTLALPFIGYLCLFGLSVISTDFRNRTAVMIFTRIERWQYYLGSWLGLMFFVIAAYCLTLIAFLLLMFFFGVEIPALLVLAFIKEFIQALMLYSIAFAIGGVTQKSTLFFVVAFIANVHIQNFAHYGTPIRYILNFLYLLYPAQLGEDLMGMALGTSQTNLNLSLVILVMLENFFYIGAVLIVGYAVFRRREVMAK